MRRQPVNLTAIVDPVALETEAFSLGLMSTERGVALATTTITIIVAESPDTPSGIRFESLVATDHYYFISPMFHFTYKAQVD